MINHPESESVPRQDVCRAHSGNPDPAGAVDEIFHQVAGEPLAGLVFFCSPRYDLNALATNLQTRFACPVIGCTTAGEILSPQGYTAEGLVAVAFYAPAFSIRPVFIPNLTTYLQNPDPAIFFPMTATGTRGRFALLLIDGMSLLEERTVAHIHHGLGEIPLIGGSAGDGLDFKKTYVYFNGEFHSHAAVVTILSTPLKFKPFQIQHFEPTESKLVITEADAAQRVVYEMNGRPAAEEYAQVVGVDLEQLTPAVFASHPVMLRIGGEYYVRSIQRSNPDGSLTFYCAIDNGLVLTLAASRPLAADVQKRFAALREELPDLQLILGCDCILRRLESRELDQFDSINQTLAYYPFAGFSTYGEQYGGLHMNHTLTGVAIGGSVERAFR